MKIPRFRRAPRRWSRTSLHEVSFRPSRDGTEYAALALEEDGGWTLAIRADSERSGPYAHLAQAVSAAEQSWQEHQITLQHVDTQLDQANRRV